MRWIKHNQLLKWIYDSIQIGHRNWNSIPSTILKNNTPIKEENKIERILWKKISGIKYIGLCCKLQYRAWLIRILHSRVRIRQFGKYSDPLGRSISYVRGPNPPLIPNLIIRLVICHNNSPTPLIGVFFFPNFKYYFFLKNELFY